jgi:hypothetical protein
LSSKEEEKLEVTTMFKNLTLFFPFSHDNQNTFPYVLFEELDKNYKYLKMSNNLWAREYRGHTIYVVGFNNYYFSFLKLMTISKR